MGAINPFLLAAMLYFAWALLAASNAALAPWQVVPEWAGLPWLRIHFITLGVLTELCLGLLPPLAAERAGRPRPATRWDVWLVFNLGFLCLVAGRPALDHGLIALGGALVLAAVVLFARQIHGLGPPGGAGSRAPGAGGTSDVPSRGAGEVAWDRRYYVTGLLFLAVGVVVGTGYWLGWSGPLRIASPREVHIHANSWGFLSLVFAGVIAGQYPAFTGRPIAWPRSVGPIWALMTLGAFGLVAGPWLGLMPVMAAGLALHLAGTLALLANVALPILRVRESWTPGLLHLVTGYLWFLVPVFVAPLALLEVPGLPIAVIEQYAPQALIYGWALSFAYAIWPEAWRRLHRAGGPAVLGGTWLSLGAVHLGAVLMWMSIFLPGAAALLRGGAYLAWLVSALPILGQMRSIVREGSSDGAAPGDAPGPA